MNCLDAGNSISLPRYVFAASTTSGVVTGFTTFSVLMMSGDVFGLRSFSGGEQMIGRCYRFIGGTPYRRVSLAAGLSILPCGTAYLSHQFVKGGSSDYPPAGAVIAGWFGGSVSLGSASLMAHLDSCKNINVYKRFCFASKLGSATAVCGAMSMIYARKKLQCRDRGLFSE